MRQSLMNRRRLLMAATGGAAVASLPAQATSEAPAASAALPDRSASWAAIKEQFDADPTVVQMSAFYLASHPRPVREAIERHRRGLDRDAHSYIEGNIGRFERAVREAASAYMGVVGDDLAFTGSTTMGLGLVYSGFALKPGQEILTDTRDHIVTTLSATSGAERSGATLRQAALYADPAAASADEVAETVRRNLRQNTRLLAVTWVHSGTGVKMPIKDISDVVRAHNRDKSPDERTILAVDGVHGLGIEDVSVPELGADFFIAGTHKWLTGPRGTGLVWARPEAWALIRPTVPTFDPMWRTGPVEQMPPAAWHTPGGFHSFEHRWALAEAFQFHSAIGRDRVADRIHRLNSLAKAEMAKSPKLRLHTPASPELSAGIVAFEVEGYTPRQVVERLHARRIIASVTPDFYQPGLARIAPSLMTTEEDVERTVAAIAAL